MTTIKQLRKKIIRLVDEQDPRFRAVSMSEAVKCCNCILHFGDSNDHDDYEFALETREAVLTEIARAMGDEVADSCNDRNFGIENIDDVRPPYFGKRGRV